MSVLLNESCIIFDIESTKKEDVIKTLVTALNQTGKISGIEEFYEDVLSREAISPTYIGFEMGLPHGKSTNVLEPAICFGRMNHPVMWNEETKECADLVILIAVPLNEAGNTHMKILANLSRKIMHDDFRESLRNSTKEQVYEILTTVLEG